MKTLLLDNYDSFSRILFQYLWEVNGERPLFVRNDEWDLDRLRAARFDNIVISPGPGRPENARDFGICLEAIRAFPEVPILGVCLGHQGLAVFAGARIVPAPEVRHGKYARILHGGTGLFAGLPQGFRAVRYHSLAVDAASCAGKAVVTATSEDDAQVMGLRLPDRPCYGVQFHPESIGTEGGQALLANFRDLSARHLEERGVRAGGRITQSIALTDRASPRPARVLALRELPWRDPESAFARFFLGRPASFWLDSGAAEAVAGAPAGAGVSWLGTGSRLLETRGDVMRVLEAAEAGGFRPVSERRGDPFALVGEQLSSREACMFPETCGLRGFPGGLVGWFGYELKRHAGGADRPGTPPPELPEACFLEPDRMLAFDHAARRVFAFLPGGDSAEGLRWLAATEAAWEGLSDPEPIPPAGPLPAGLRGFRLPWRPDADAGAYLSRIASLQDAIRRGESYEACLTHELRARAGADPFQVYRVLRRTNPAPYAAFLRFPQAAVLSASPERFLKLDEDGRLESRPIKGTRRRGVTPVDDAALRLDLAGHAKDHSENLMIVDLMRNDFGRVCQLGSVKVPDMMRVEEHPTVFQLVSTVEGRLEPGCPAVEAVRACFPGGSMTGAPKLRTMELLEAREGRARGVFSGALGFLGSGGTLDLGMVIRTLVHREGEFQVGCGGAILAESDPEAEFQEALLKSYAMLRAVEIAEFGGS